MPKEFKYEIKKNVGSISTSSKKWNKELNIISWNGNTPKYDLREWSPDHSQMGKGVTLSEEELRELKRIIDSEIAQLDGEEYLDFKDF